MESCVYFISDGEVVKIGHTLNVIGRLNDLQVANPKQLWLVGIIEGGISKEKELHNKFNFLKRRGEWFDLHPDVWNYLCNKNEIQKFEYFFNQEREKKHNTLIAFSRIENKEYLEKYVSKVGGFTGCFVFKEWANHIFKVKVYDRNKNIVFFDVLKPTKIGRAYFIKIPNEFAFHRMRADVIQQPKNVANLKLWR